MDQKVVKIVADVAEFLAREGLLLATVVALFLVLWGYGHGLGLPNLFWSTSVESSSHARRDRFLIGISVGVLLGADAFLGLLVESAGRSWSPEFFLRWFHGLCAGAFVLVLGSWIVLPGGFVRRRRKRPASPPTYLLPIGSAFGLTSIVAIVYLAPAITPGVLRDFVRWTLPARERESLLSFHAAAGLMLVLGTLSFFVLRILNRVERRQVTPAMAICILLAMLGAVHGFVAFRWPAGQFPFYALLIVVGAFLSASHQRSRVPELELPAARERYRALLSDEQVLESWRQLHDVRPVLVVVAADGGGIRSALWTMSVLTWLEQGFRKFPRYVRLITGASGGMVGASIWTATLHDAPSAAEPYHASNGTKLSRKGLLRITERGGLGAVASRLVFRDLFPFPLRLGPDRGRALELTWEEHCRELKQPVSSLEKGEEEGWRPSLVLTPMIVEDGRRLIVSNLDLEHLVYHHGAFANRHAMYSMGGVQLFEKLPRARERLHLSTAARLQANFPWVLPPTELPPLEPGPDAPRLRVVDAGYYDETGVDLACQWIFEHREWLKARTAGVLLIQNRDTSSIPRRKLPSRKRPGWERGFDGWTTPVSAVLRARDSTTWYHTDALVSALAHVLNTRDDPFFTTAVFELGIEASLSWSITRHEAVAIRNDIRNGENPATLASLQRWWQSREGE